jgi:hypothetical protein
MLFLLRPRLLHPSLLFHVHLLSFKWDMLNYVTAAGSAFGLDQFG